MVRYMYAAVLVLFLSVVILAPPVANADERSVTGALIEKLREKGVIDEADYAELTAPASGEEQDTTGRLVKLLYEKGVLDEASYAELGGKTATAAAATSHEEPQSSPARPGEPTVREAVTPLDQGLAAIEKGVARAGRDNVSLKINFFFQGGFLIDTAGYSVGTPPTGDLSKSADSQFFVRRARLYLSGNVLEKLGYKVSFETASSSILRDAYVYLDYIPHARVTVGQFKVPFGYEGPLALAELPVANRSLAGNFIHIPTARDRGVMLSGKVDYGTPDEPMAASYWLGAFNGAGQNRSDDNNHKDVALRARFNPLLGCLTLGGSWYKGSTRQSGGADKDWDRWGAELEWKPKRIKGAKVLGEFVWNRQYFDTYIARNINDTTNTTANPLPPFGRYAHGYGWYALAAYRLNGFGGGWGFLNGFEPVARYDMLDEDTAVTDNERTRTTLGLNYYLAKDTRLMLNYELIHADGRLRERSLQVIDNVSHKLLTTLMQVKF